MVPLPDPKPVVYILHGDDEFAMAKYIDAMYKRLGDPTLADLNFSRLDGRTFKENDLQNATGSMPFLAERRLVVLFHPFARQPDANQRAARAQYQEQFLARLNHLPDTAALVLVIEDHPRKGDWEVLHGEHWLMAWAKQAGEKAFLRTFSLPTPGEMQKWIRKQAEETALKQEELAEKAGKKGKILGQFTAQAALALVEQVGTDTRVAALEIEKLLNYVNYARPVEQDDVANLTTRLDQPNIFAMVDALGSRDGHKATAELHILLETQDPLSLFGMIVRQFRLLLLVREIMDQGGGPGQAAEHLRGEPFRVNPFAASKLYKQASQFSLAGLEAIFRRLLALDETFKSSQMEASVALDAFIAELAG
jgi:DNA polymerase-3 subunit delta